MDMTRAELLEHYISLQKNLQFDLVSSAQVNTRLFIYECVQLIKSASIPSEFFQEALSLVALQDKYKFQIITDTSKLLIDNTNDIDEVRLFTKNTFNFLKHLQEKIYQDNCFDSLTGVFNYNYLQKIESEISTRDFTLFFFDLDGLKKKNDLHGHEYGNRLIQNFARVLKSSFRFDDLVIRYGGDEFVVIVFRDNLNPKKVIDKINKHPQKSALDLSFSVGFSKNTNQSVKTTLSNADRLMYSNKESK